MKREIVRKPGKDDVHEQRERNQPYEGALHVGPVHRDQKKKTPPKHAKR